MHTSSLKRMEWFESSYSKYFSDSGVSEQGKIRVLDIGSCNVNGTYRDIFKNENYSYAGLDVSEGENVTIVPENIYHWSEIEDNTYNVVISGQAFEHIEYIWLTIREIERVLKPDGICCIIAPNSQEEHHYPTDCWRFFSDGWKALASWANLEVLHTSVAGIPDNSASSEWDSVINDSMLIAKKKGTHQMENPPQLPLERRFSSNIYKERYFTLVKWIKMRDAALQIRNWLKERGYTNIAIYGMGHMGRILYEQIKETDISIICAVDKEQGGKDIDGIRVAPSFANVEKKMDAILVSIERLYDVEKDIKPYVEENIQILYLSEILEDL